MVEDEVRPGIQVRDNLTLEHDGRLRFPAHGVPLCVGRCHPDIQVGSALAPIGAPRQGQPSSLLFDLSGQPEGDGVVQHASTMSSYVLAGDAIQPGLEVGRTIGEPVVGHVLVQDAKGAIEVPGSHELFDGGHEVAGLLVPGAGTRVQHPGERRIVGQQGVEELSKQLVVAVTARVSTEWGNEQAGAYGLPQKVTGVAASEQEVCQFHVELINHRGCLQERHHPFRLVLEHLLHQEVGNDAFVPGESANERGCVVPVPEGQRGQLQSRQPPLRSPGESPNLVGGQVEAEVRHQEPDVALTEPQVGISDLGQLALARQRWRGNMGSTRLAITMWSSGGSRSTKVARPPRAEGGTT